MKEKIDNYLELLTNELAKLEELQPKNLDDHSLLLGVKFPINDKSFNLKASFMFKPPILNKIGSYQYDCLVKDQHNLFIIDLALEIPKECWQKNDHFNYVYHRKRGLYLAYIGLKLQTFKSIVSSVEFGLQNGDHLKPILLLTPAGKLSTFCQFKILPFPSQSKSFVFRNFSPNKCNVQAKVFDQNSKLQFSPLYNSSILKDITMPNYSNLMSEIFSNQSNVLDALVLLRIWLENRGLRKDFAHILTVFTSYLLKENLINPHLSGLQLFKSILQFISNFSFVNLLF